jgi:hypothetical protein
MPAALLFFYLVIYGSYGQVKKTTGREQTDKRTTESNYSRQFVTDFKSKKCGDQRPLNKNGARPKSQTSRTKNKIEKYELLFKSFTELRNI